MCFSDCHLVKVNTDTRWLSEEYMTTEEKLKQLREKWKTAGRDERKLIEMQARLLEIGIEKREKKIEQLTMSEVKEIFK